MKPALTDEEIEQVIESLDTAHSRCREIERLTRERMADRIEKLEAGITDLLYALKFERDALDAFRWTATGPGDRLREAERNAQVILAAERGEER